MPYFSTRLLFMKSDRVLGSVMKLIVLSNVTICKETETYASLRLIQINTIHHNYFILTVFNIFIVQVHTTIIHWACTCTCISSLFKYSFLSVTDKTILQIFIRYKIYQNWTPSLICRFWSKFIQSNTTRKTGVLAFNYR